MFHRHIFQFNFVYIQQLIEVTLFHIHDTEGICRQISIPVYYKVACSFRNWELLLHICQGIMDQGAIAWPLPTQVNTNQKRWRRIDLKQIHALVIPLILFSLNVTHRHSWHFLFQILYLFSVAKTVPKNPLKVRCHMQRFVIYLPPSTSTSSRCPAVSPLTVGYPQLLSQYTHNYPRHLR
jgi:hypothetical protein